MVNGVLYSTAGSRRAVVALDAATGELLWMHSENEGARGAAAPRQLSGRGLAYWTDGRDERILYVTPGYRLIALDAKTGAPVAGFGKSGVVDLKLDDDQEIDLITGEIGLHATPIVAKDVVIVGAAHKTGGIPKSRRNVKGYVRGFDVRTGKRLWIFHTIPQPGEFGNDTWEKDSWAYTGNTGVWGQISVDEELGLVYLPVELPTGDYYGGHRPGNGLFGESLVAVDLKTGKRKWHYQLVHHGIWDMDIPCAPILADITVNGRTIKAVAQPTKQAFLYVFDRVTGEPVWPIEERPVAKGDVPGEWYSPTQPFPTKPPAYERQGVSVDDLIDFTPELRAEAVKAGRALQARSDLHAAGGEQARRSARHARLPGVRRHQLAGRLLRSGDAHRVHLLAERCESARAGAAAGRTVGHELHPGNALTGRAGLAAPVSGRRRAHWETAPRGRGARRRRGSGGGLTVQGLPLVKPPYGRITAIDLNKGEICGRSRTAKRRQRPQSSGAQRPDYSAHRPARPDRPAGDQDAGDRRRGRRLHDAVGAARRDAARLRQGDRQRSRRRLHAGAAERVADDLHAERQAIHRRRHQRRELQRRAARVPAPGSYRGSSIGERPSAFSDGRLSVPTSGVARRSGEGLARTSERRIT